MDLMHARIDLFFRPDQFSQRNFRQGALHNFMKTDDHRSNPAVARVHAGLEHAGMRLAEAIDGVFVENPYYFIQVNVRSRTRQRVTPVRPALGLHEAGFYQNPHQLAGVRNRKPLTLRDLMERQRFVCRLDPGQLDQASQAIFFVS